MRTKILWFVLAACAFHAACRIPIARADTDEAAHDAASPLRLAVLAGGRGNELLHSPVLMGVLSHNWGLLELGAVLSLEPHYFFSKTRSEEALAFAGGFQLGVRAPVGALDVLAGGRAMLGVIAHHPRELNNCTGLGDCKPYLDDHRKLELRAGGYAGLSVPRDADLRFRLDLGVDVVTPTPAEERLALTPSWALSGLLGIELVL